MIKRWFTISDQDNSSPENIYRLGTIVLIIMAVSLSIVALWREINQLTSSTSLEQLPLSETSFLLVLTSTLVGICVFIGWHLMGRRSLDENWQVQGTIARLFWGLALVALIVMFFHGVWHIPNRTVSIWSLPSILSVVLLSCICLLALQLESVKHGARRWGFSMSGFDRRDTINMAMIGFLFFAASHLVVQYDSQALNSSQLPLWFLPVFSIATAIILSTLSTHIVRIPMATFIAGFFALSIRNAIFAGLSLDSLGATVIPVILGPVFVLDVWQWFKSGQASTLSTAIVAAVALFLNYPIFDEWIGITFSGPEYILIIAGSLMVSLGAANIAKSIALWIEINDQSEASAH